MFTLSCFYEPWWAYLLRILFEGSAELMLYATPVAICAVVWDVFGNKESTPQDMTVLGLDASAETYLPSGNSVFPLWTVLLYLLTGSVTFGIGLLLFNAVQALS
ncbi:MAG: hypothetical protein LC794_11315 [Acidobacteria bacterium]|nr:hypothetical protein [Acidobacteriota bacterium]